MLVWCSTPEGIEAAMTACWTLTLPRRAVLNARRHRSGNDDSRALIVRAWPSAQRPKASKRQ